MKTARLLPGLLLVTIMGTGCTVFEIGVVPLYEGPERPLKEVAVLFATNALHYKITHIDEREVSRKGRHGEFHLPPGKHTIRGCYSSYLDWSHLGYRNKVTWQTGGETTVSGHFLAGHVYEATAFTPRDVNFMIVYWPWYWVRVSSESLSGEEVREELFGTLHGYSEALQSEDKAVRASALADPYLVEIRHFGSVPDFARWLTTSKGADWRKSQHLDRRWDRLAEESATAGD